MGSASLPSTFCPSHIGWLTYRIADDACSTTTVLPAISGRWAMSTPTLIAAPLDGPTSRPSYKQASEQRPASLHASSVSRHPSCAATRLAHSHDSGVDACANSSIAPRGPSAHSWPGASFSMSGSCRLAPIPTTPCMPPGAPTSTRASVGSTQTTRHEGFFDLRYWPAPLSVPPVPAPATKQSTSPSVCSQISGPVPVRCASGLSSESNCEGVQ
mmetsp:Transcript_8999/g.26524  ORF Transcript_8999/g.26524 Transcript_8999/m.26524 type:complete len:214 (-) Transcript_8999:451-1092(-)